jgi:predicted Zn-dependent protease
VWHYAVLVGFDPQANLVYLNSGGERGLAMPAPAFLRTWNWGGNWAMVALRPGELPAQVDREQYLSAIATFAGVSGEAAAAPAWRAALSRWPQAPMPYLALGNLAYGQGNLPLALDYFRRGLRYNDGDPALANNLASVLGELGCPGAGIALLAPIRDGLAADSDWRPVLSGTLVELQGGTQRSTGFCAALLPDQRFPG